MKANFPKFYDYNGQEVKPDGVDLCNRSEVIDFVVRNRIVKIVIPDKSRPAFGSMLYQSMVCVA